MRREFINMLKLEILFENYFIKFFNSLTNFAICYLLETYLSKVNFQFKVSI